MNDMIDQTLENVISSGFTKYPELLRFVTKEFLQSERRSILSQVLKLDPAVQLKKAYELSVHKAKELYQIYHEEELRIQRKEEKERVLQEKIRISEIAKIELSNIIDQILKSKDNSMTVAQRESLKYFKFIYVDGKRDPEISYLFPNTSRDQRYQWKTRAIKMIAPLASQDSKKYISERSKIKYAVNELFVAADEFLKICLQG